MDNFNEHLPFDRGHTHRPTPPVGRLAPTPSGHLHLGNVLAFGAAALMARGGRLLLRIEDLDRGRARETIAAAQREDLAWLGIHWEEETTPQSRRTYSVVGLDTFRCDCPRSKRLSGSCEHRQRPATTGSVRFASPREEVQFTDIFQGPQRFMPEEDPILMRADGEAAYPLAVVQDDHRDGITQVVRGADLLSATATQLCMQRQLGLQSPSYAHVPVLLGADGKKLSKSHGSTEVRALRAAGWTADDIWALLLPILGCVGQDFAHAQIDPGAVARGPLMVYESGPTLRIEPPFSQVPRA